MITPINKETFTSLIDNSKIFHLTNKLMASYLQNWYLDDKVSFNKCMAANFDTVMKTYQFTNEGVSISKSYSFTPPLDYITCSIRIYDSEDTYCAEYTAYFDYELNCFDDKCCK